MRPATFWERVGALLIDYVVLLPFGIAPVLLAEYVSPYVGIGLRFLFIPVGFMYASYFLILRGQTVGKKAMQIKVVSMLGRNLTRKEAYLRNSIDLVFACVNGFIALMGSLEAVKFIELGASYKGLAGKVEMLNRGSETGFGQFMGYFMFAYIIAQLIAYYRSPERQALHDLLAGTRVIKFQISDEFAANATNN